VLVPLTKILIADDDLEIVELLADAVRDEGWEPVVCQNGEEAYRRVLAKESFDLVILDIMMPGMDGLELCRRIRDQVLCPILFLSAKAQTFDTMLGLEMGADDYIAKPFAVEELMARIRAHLRREQRRERRDGNRVLRLGELELHQDSFEAFKAGTPAELSPREFQLLWYLAENVNRVLTKEQIFNAVWGMEYGDIGTVAVNIKNLRDKIDPDNRYIKTVWGVGYKLVRPVEQEP
jgi:DNA-binding response OmpR family regulator